MKALLMPNLEWSKRFPHEFASDHFCYLHHGRELTHIDHHKAEVWRFSRNGRTTCEGYVEAGPCGEMQYLRREFTRVEDARMAVERAVQRAIQDGAMSVNGKRERS